LSADEALDDQRREIPGLPPSEEAAAQSSLAPVNSDIQEANLVNRGATEAEWRADAEQREHHRNQKFRDNFERIAILSLWATFLVALAIGVTWFYHLLTPEKYHFLNPEQISKLQNIVTGGILASIASGHIKKRLG